MLRRGVKGRDGRVSAHRITWLTHAQAAEDVRRQGFRLPSSDQWEHACRAGSPTFWRWGDECPTDHYPAGDRAAEDAAWDLHRRPNAFGLRIAADPYQWEVVAEPGLKRGGDGGGAIHGGEGFFLGWLPLASAYVDQVDPFHRDRPLPLAHARRLFPLA